MGSRNFDIDLLQARFDGLDSIHKSEQWVHYVDALDHGDAGFHTYHLILSPLYERGETPFDAERLEMLEISNLEFWDDEVSTYKLELELDALAPMGGWRATGPEMDAAFGSPPF